MTSTPDADAHAGDRRGPDEEGGSGSSTSSRRVVIWAIVALVVVLAIGGGVGFAVSRSDTATYDDATRERFITACTADGGDDVVPACECLYESIVEKIPYERFEEIDAQLTAAREVGEEITLPDDIEALIPACQVPA